MTAATTSNTLFSSPQEITELLSAWRNGDQAALEQLNTLVYDQLRAIAHNRLRRESPGHGLQTTGLVNELYLRLLPRPLALKDRAHFYRLAARMMRNILIDLRRKPDALNQPLGAWEEVAQMAEARDGDLLALDEALTALDEAFPRQAQIIELRYFGGLSVAETAETLAVSEETILRDARFAKAWLRRYLKRRPEAEGER